MTGRPRNHVTGIYTRTLKDGKTVVYDAVVQVNGRQRWSRGHATQVGAKDARDEMRMALRTGSMGNAPVRLTLADYLQKRWWPAKEADIASASTHRSYRGAMQRAVESIGAVRLLQLGPFDIEAFKMALRRAGLAGTSAVLSYYVLNQALKQAVRWGIIVRNPCDMVDPPRATKREPAYLETSQIVELLRSADATPYGCLIYLAVATGLRWGELTSLRWADVDFATELLRVRASKTPRGVRAVALGPDTMERLRQHRLDQMRTFKDHGLPPPQLVFLTENGAQLNAGNFHTRWWSRIRRDAGLPKLRFHDLRHAQATLLARAGVHPRVAQDRLGHVDSKTTLEVYTHLVASDQTPAARAVEALLRGTT